MGKNIAGRWLSWFKRAQKIHKLLTEDKMSMVQIANELGLRSTTPIHNSERIYLEFLASERDYTIDEHHISALDVSIGVVDELLWAGYHHIRDLINLSDEELSSIYGIGQKGLLELSAELDKYCKKYNLTREKQPTKPYTIVVNGTICTPITEYVKIEAQDKETAVRNAKDIVRSKYRHEYPKSKVSIKTEHRVIDSTN